MAIRLTFCVILGCLAAGCLLLVLYLAQLAQNIHTP